MRTPRHLRLSILVIALAIVAAACSGASTEIATTDGPSTDDVDTNDAANGPRAVPVDQIPGDEPDVRVSALAFPLDRDLPDPILDPDVLRAGGPPPDGIPPVDDPVFLRVDDVDFVGDDEPVLVLTIGDDTRIYPVQIMIWHEIVNDTVDRVPVSVTYCPLCNSAIAYDRRLDERVLDFGTSGMLYNSAMIMYDRQTESLWSHFTGQAVIGDLTGAQLDVLPVATVSWADARATHPGALVLSRRTGHDRRYGENPYPGYDDVNTTPFLFTGETDGRLPAKTRIVGVEDKASGDAVAVLLDHLVEERVVDIDNGSRTVTVWHTAGTSSALDASSIDGGRDIGATGAFVAEVDGEPATFEPTDAGFVDSVTGSTWNILGTAVAGPQEGATLDAVAHVDTFWFAWASFLPDTAVVPPLA